MITNWEYSLESEAERLAHCAYGMITGFYRVNNFIVLPYSPKVKNSLTVTFPDLPFNKIPRFWEKSKKVKITDSFFEVDPKFKEEILKLIKTAHLEDFDYSKTKKSWEKIENKIIKKIYEIIPSKKDIIKKITIHSTAFGTSCSFSYKPTKDGQIYIFLRKDSGIFEITEAIVTSLTRDEIFKDLSGIWQESEIITDWILTKSSLSEILKKNKKNITPTIKGTRIKQQAKLMI